MAHQDVENPLVLVFSSLAAVSGVVVMRSLMGMDYHQYALAYMAMGLTASIRRTSSGNNFSPWSALRGLACLLAGLSVCRWMGYPMGSYLPPVWMPEEFALAVSRFR